MTKDNILFGIIGLLGGLIIGFFVTNSINKQQGVGMATTPPATTTVQNGQLPAGHPEVAGGADGQQSAMGVPEVQAAIEKARAEPDNFDAQMHAADLYNQIQRFD